MQQQFSIPDVWKTDEYDAGAAETILLVQTALNSMRGKSRIALELRFYDGESFSEMAVSLGVSKMTAWRILQRALSQLRQILSKRNDGFLFVSKGDGFEYWK